MPHERGSEKLERIAQFYNATETGIPWDRFGFHKRIIHVAKHLIGEGLPEHARQVVDIADGIIPDASYVCCKDRLLYALEVEDTSTLTNKKLRRYELLWEELDASSKWDIYLVIADRYGRGERLQLGTVWMARLYARNDLSKPSRAGRYAERRFRDMLGDVSEGWDQKG